MSSPASKPKRTRGQNHFVGEWFGQRIYPEVQLDKASLRTLKSERCPFLSLATGKNEPCIKPAASRGVCTITSRDGLLYERAGDSIDWLVCPYRTLDPMLLEEIARRLFEVDEASEVFIPAAVTLGEDPVRSRVRQLLDSGGRVFAYFRARLGGEISLSPTDRSPEFAFDITLVELEDNGTDQPEIGRYAVVEIQTMEFHGSYSAATTALVAALDLHSNFASEIKANPEWAGRKIQGPSIADTFKRTFYQMVFKFQLGIHEHCAGCALALPRSVWNTWQRHLGRPTLTPVVGDSKLFTLSKPESVSLTEAATAWIVVFDTDMSVGSSPNPLPVDLVVQTGAPTLVHYAFDVAPEEALGGGATDALYADICARVLTWWPELRHLGAD